MFPTELPNPNAPSAEEVVLLRRSLRSSVLPAYYQKQISELTRFGGLVSTLFLAGDSATPKCIEFGEAISSKVNFCLQCGTSQTKVAHTLIKCISCDAEIPEFAKFCEECGATQNREAKAIQEDESAQYRKAAGQGDVCAQFSLGVMYENGQGGLAKDEAQALSWYQKAADLGDAEAQYNLGVMFWHGRGGLAPDDAQAVTWYRKAADQGDIDAQYNLGVMYENGQGGFAEDDAQALSWYQKAADQGDAEAQANINRLEQESENADEPKKQVSIFVETPSLVASTAFLR
jgi:hypothetical protein